MGHDATAEHLLQTPLPTGPGDAAPTPLQSASLPVVVTVLHAWRTSRPNSQSGPMTPNFSAAAHLLASAGQPRQNAPFAGLEALGKVTAADRSLLSGLGTSRCAR
ncbi:MAG: hypothetical protein CM15mP18_3960 [Methanobacteriota archaeon]|nr:MAG: hypothetical protein CM15mP18_3960 [Euryarchaeota archaeon]